MLTPLKIIVNMQGENEVTLMVLYGTLIILLFVVVIFYFIFLYHKKYLLQQNELQRVENEKEQSLLKAILQTQESERNRIARNLHDTVGAELSMLKLNFSKYFYFLKNTTFETEHFANDLNNLDSTIDTISRVCKDLYPLMLQNTGLTKSVEEISRRLNETGFIKCNYSNDLQEKDINLSSENALHFFRIYQEVLNNIIKHSKCNRLNINLSQNNGQLRISFRHNGITFTNDHVSELMKKNKGLGLGSINNRINLMKGNINYFMQNDLPGILIELPLAN